MPFITYKSTEAEGDNMEVGNYYVKPISHNTSSAHVWPSVDKTFSSNLYNEYIMMITYLSAGVMFFVLAGQFDVQFWLVMSYDYDATVIKLPWLTCLQGSKIFGDSINK